MTALLYETDLEEIVSELTQHSGKTVFLSYVVSQRLGSLFFFLVCWVIFDRSLESIDPFDFALCDGFIHIVFPTS